MIMMTVLVSITITMSMMDWVVIFYFSVVCVSKTKEARERVSSVEHLYVDHTDCRQWSADVYVQHGMVCQSELSKEGCKYSSI